MYRICERCGDRCHEWTVQQAQIRVGELDSRINLCAPCTAEVQGIVLAALRLPRKGGA